MYLATSNHATTANRAMRPLRALLVIVAALAVLPIAGCSGASANAPAMTQPANSPARAVSSNPQVAQTLDHSCFDCHSDQDSAPWNARLAPSYLFGAGDARKALNFSDWQGYDALQKRAKKAAIAKVMENDSMPPWDYGFLHPSAKLTEQQRSELLQWASREPAAKP